MLLFTLIGNSMGVIGAQLILLKAAVAVQVNVSSFSSM
jgi:hypothetical protein